MKLDYIKLEKELIEIKSENSYGDSNYYTLLIGENGVGKTKIFEDIIKENNNFKKVIFSAYTLFNRTSKDSLDKSSKVYISNFNSKNIINEVANLYVKNMWLYKNYLFSKTLNEIYKILEVDNQVSVNLSSITRIGYPALLNKIQSYEEDMKLENLLEKREEYSKLDIETFLKLSEEKRPGFSESQISKKLNEHFINNKKIKELSESKKRIYETILILKSILIIAGYNKRRTGNKSTYFYYDEIKKIYHNYFKIDGGSITEILMIDFKIFTILGLDFANNLLFTNKYEATETKQLSELSSGEFALITRFMELAGEIENNSLILIDEPETYLNPKWVNEFIYFLKTLFKDMDCHFIIASQSPFIISNLNREDIIKLKKEKGEITYKYEEEATFGLDFNSIIKEIFNMDLIDSKLVGNYFEKIRSEENILKSFRMLSNLADSKEKIQLIREIANEDNLKIIKEEISEIERKHFNE